MKIYLDKNKRVTGYEMTFFKKGEKRPVTDLDHGHTHNGLMLNERQNNFISYYLDSGGKVTDLVMKNNFFVVDKIAEKGDTGCDHCARTVMITLNNYKPDSDLSRHFKDSDQYLFKELNTIPFKDIDEQYLYPFDKLAIKTEEEGKSRIKPEQRRFFGLFNKDNQLVAFLFVIFLNLPTILVLYHNEIYGNGGYVIVDNLIKQLQKDGYKYLDMGGLTKEESGINQFKRKFGMEILMVDRNLYMDSA